MDQNKPSSLSFDQEQFILNNYKLVKDLNVLTKKVFENEKENLNNFQFTQLLFIWLEKFKSR